MANSVPEIDETVLDTWFERDRQHVCLSRRNADGSAGETIVEWWDEAVSEAVTDGFLDPRDYHGSAYEYAEEQGLLTASAPVSISPAPMGVVRVSESFGVYMGWHTGGTPIWSGQATDEEIAAGAWAYGSFEDAMDDAERDVARAVSGIRFASDGDRDAYLAGIGLPDDQSFEEVELDVTPPGRSKPSRASLESCEVSGIVLPQVGIEPNI